MKYELISEIECCLAYLMYKGFLPDLHKSMKICRHVVKGTSVERKEALMDAALFPSVYMCWFSFYTIAFSLIKSASRKIIHFLFYKY